MTVRQELRKNANHVFRSSQPKGHQPRQTVLMVITTWKVDIRQVDREIERLSILMGPSVRRAMHANRMISFVVVTADSSVKLKATLAPEADRMGLLENLWVMPASDEIASLQPIDPLQHHVHEAWRLVHDHNNPPKRPTTAEIFQRHVRPGGDAAAAVRASLQKKATA